MTKKTFEDFWYEHSEWSQNTFGRDDERGPRGPLLHLQKEVKEALAEIEAEIPNYELTRQENLKEEITDCLFLVFDAARRAGMTPEELVKKAFWKLEINRNRHWNKPTSDAPVEHIRDPKLSEV